MDRTLRVRLHVGQKREVEPFEPLKLTQPVALADIPSALDVNRANSAIEWRFSFPTPEVHNDRCIRRMVFAPGSGDMSDGPRTELSITQGIRTGRVYDFVVEVSGDHSIDGAIRELPRLLPELLKEESHAALRGNRERRKQNEALFREAVEQYARREMLRSSSVPRPNTLTWL